MSFLDRTGNIIRSKINKILDKIEDPREELDSSYEKQLDLLHNVNRGIADLTTAKKQLEQQKIKLLKSIFDIDDQASSLLKQGNEPLARAALERKVQTEDQINSLTQQIKKVTNDQNKLIEAQKSLEIKIEQFKAKKETMKAQLSAAEAQVKVGESLSGLGSKIGNVGDAMRRAEDKTETMTARASAINELTESGVIDNNIDGSTRLDREISSAKRKSKVDEQLEAMKKQIKR